MKPHLEKQIRRTLVGFECASSSEAYAACILSYYDHKKIYSEAVAEYRKSIGNNSNINSQDPDYKSVSAICSVLIVMLLVI